MDSRDENEEKAFGFVTPPMIKDAMNGVVSMRIWGAISGTAKPILIRSL